MTDIQIKTREFITDAIRLRLSSDIPPAPVTKEELALRVAEGLIYLSFLPQVISMESQPKEKKQIALREYIKAVADEVSVVIAEYFYSTDKPDPQFPYHIKRGILPN